MPTTLAALNVLLLLLPGFLIQRIVEGLAVLGKRTNTQRVTDALSFSLLHYTLFALIGRPLGLDPVPFSVITSTGRPSFEVGTVRSLAVLLLLATGVALVLAVSISRGWHFGILRKFGVTWRTGRADVWHDIFSDFRGKWTLVYLEDGTRVLGWPNYYSDTPERRELFLCRALVEGPDGDPYEVRGPGVLLTEQAKIERIEVIDETVQ